MAEMKRLLCTIAVLLLVAPAVPGATRVALMDFVSDDNSYRGTLKAADFSTLVQADVIDAPNIEWVERSQLQLAKNELTLAVGGHLSAPAAVHLGKFVKADLLINGKFTITSNQGRELHIEVIDLEHADVLTEMILPIHGGTNAPLEVSVSEAALAGEKIKSALQRSLERNKQIKSQTVIAPLFFANTSASRRLDYLETELQLALAEALPSQNIRLLRFPKAAAATSEADMIWAGLVEQDLNAWQKVADIYVWGQYEEITPDDFAFKDTPVKFTLNYWDGNGDVKSISETAKVAELSQLKERLVQRTLQAAKSHTKQSVSEQARHQVAIQLFSRANEIQLLPKPSTQTAQAQQLHEYQVKLLTIAHFFAPENYIICRIWLESRWAQTPRLFWQQMEQIRSYQDFDDTFGLISPKELSPDLTPKGTWSNYTRRRVAYSIIGHWRSIKDDFCDSIDGEDGVGFPIAKAPDFPRDAPRGVLESWKSQISDDFARRLFKMYEAAIHASPPIEVINAAGYMERDAFELKDQQLKAKFVEDLWPAYVRARDTNSTARHEYNSEEFDYFFVRGLFPKIEKVFADAGQPQKAAVLIAQFKQKITIAGLASDEKTTSELAAQEHLPKIISVNLLPPKLSPDFRSVIFPSTSVNGVVALKYDNGSLWISTRAGVITLSDRKWEYLTSSHPNAALWRLTSNNTAPKSFSNAFGKHSKITSLCVQNDKLWMTLEQDGVCCLTPADLKDTFYGDKQGVLSRQMFASASVGNRLYFGGGEPGSGKLNSVELPGLTWKSQSLPSGDQIKVLQPCGNRLLVNNRILDTDNQTWGALGFEVLAATFDSKKLWLGTPGGFVSHDPDTGIETEWQSSHMDYSVDASGDTKMAAALNSRLPGAVTALANDGDFLWIAATTRFNHWLDGNGKEGRWINGNFVLTLHPGIDVGGSGKNGEWRNMYVKGEANCVMLFHKPTGKWVGYFPVTSRVTSLAVSREKLWVALEDTGYLQYGQHDWQDKEIFAPSPLLEIQKAPLTSISPNKWVSDQISESELKSHIQEAAQALKTTHVQPADTDKFLSERFTFLQNSSAHFLPVEFQKSPGGDAVLQNLPVRKQMVEYEGKYYFGFTFTMPAWLDGDFKWMYALAKTESQKDFAAQPTFYGIFEQNGLATEFDYKSGDSVKNYPTLERRLPYSHTLNIFSLTRDRLKAGKSYAIWFDVAEKDYPDIAFAITIDSVRGTSEFGKLPLK
jgi:hypothetical protein